jgi:glucosamine 6-phosphate synthetase-like amidotransferase/phosphosugar isomerase protein
MDRERFAGAELRSQPDCRRRAVEVAATGALVLTATVDPMAELVKVQRLAVALATAKGLDPDRPRNLSRSVILPLRPG